MTTADAFITGPMARGAPAVSCAHCALPVPVGLIEDGTVEQFCCHGCRTAWGVIRSCGLERFHELARTDPRSRAPARPTGRGYEEFDDPVFTAAHCVARPGGLMSASLVLENVHCAACVWLLERLPRAIEGVAESRLDFRRSRLEVVWDPARVRLSRVAALVDRLGYPAHPARGREREEARKREDRRALVRIGIAAALAGNAMLIAFALYGGMLSGMERSFDALFRGVSAALGLVAVAWPGSVFFRGALASLRVRSLHMDVPIALALAIGLGYGLYNTARGAGDIYFETLTTLVFLLLVGRWVQSRQQKRAADAVELLFSLAPSSAVRREADGSLRPVPVEALRVGDEIEVGAGSTVPADAEVIEGRTEVNNAFLTGELRPAPVSVGERVCAGAVNLASPVVARVLATGEATRAGKLMRLVEESSARRAPVVRVADRLAGWFVAAVLLLTAVTVGVWWSKSPELAVEHAVALLIVTCPCALGLATPLAVVAAVGRAAQRGILVKGGDTLEAMARPGTLVLDKTGTLTTGRMTLVGFRGDESVRAAVAAVERKCDHPVARALVAGLPEPAPGGRVEIAHTLGGGVEAALDGERYAVGSVAFVRARTEGEPDWFDGAVRGAANAGHTPIAVAKDGRIAALAVVGDSVRGDARAAVDALRSSGWSVRVLSGDHPAIVERVGAELGIDVSCVEGGATPERKLEVVEVLAAHGRVVMVGDGVNDAAALAAATVGVAVHGGAEASMGAADVYLSRPGLTPLVELTEGARRTMRVIRRNLAVSLAYNAVAAGLAIGGLLNPLVAAVLMPLSGLSVIVLSYRSRTFDGAGPCR